MKKNLLLFVLVIFRMFSANAQWSGDPQVADTKVCTHSADQSSSFIIPDGSGGAIIFWEDFRNGTGYDIYYNKLNASGNAVWSSVSAGLSLTNTTNYDYIDQVISDGSGGAFVSWETEGGEVLVQHIDNAGVKTWTAAGVSLSTTGNACFICSDENGGIIITWSDYRADMVNYNPRSYVQRVNSTGSKVWAASGIELNSSASGYSASIGIVPDGLGGAIIATGDTRNSNYDPLADTYDNIDIYAQRIDASGNAVWAAEGLPVCTQSGNQVSDLEGQYPVVISDGSGGAVIAWDDYRNDPNNGNSSPYNEDIFCQRLNSNGVAQWTADGVALSTMSNDDYQISLMPDGSGGAVAAWYDEGSSFGVYAQKINGSGTVQWATNGIAIASEIISFTYTASADATNSSMLIAWLSNGGDIKAQKVNVANGALSWAAGTLVCGRTDYEQQPAITHNGGSGAIISWTDDRNSGTSGMDIYANRVISNGTLPVTLINFEVSLQPAYISVQWATATEVNSQDFNVQRSLDGINFETIASVPAAGNSNTVLNYRYDDAASIALGGKEIFYRIVEADIDGYLFYTDVKKVKIPDGKNKFTLVYNPVRNEALLNYECVEKNKVLIKVADHLGRIVIMKQLNVTAGNNQIKLQTGNLAKGIYEVELTSNKDHGVVRMIKE